MQDDGSDLLMYCHRQVWVVFFVTLNGKQNNIYFLPVDHQHLDFFVTVLMSVFCAVIHYQAGWKFSILAFKKISYIMSASSQ